MKRFLLVLSMVSLISSSSIGQEIEYPVKKNVLKASVASMGMINGMISVDYERTLFYGNNFKLNIEGTYGKYYESYTRDVFQSFPGFHSLTCGINSLIGKNAHFFELSVGARYSIINDDYYEDMSAFFPVLNIGYRYQNPYGKGLVFRTYVGTTGVGLSIGKAF